LISKIKWDSPQQILSTGEEIEVLKCNGKKKAIEAARKLYKKHANLFDELSYIEAKIMPEIAY
jgi:hypothetical protein